MQYLYQTIKEYLLALIAENKDTPHFKLPSENRLAKKFGASRYAVRHALEQLQSRNIIYSVPGKGAFVNPNIGRRLSDEKRNVVQIVLPYLKSNHAQRIIRGATRFCDDNGYELHIQFTENDPKEEAKILRTAEETCKGLLLYPVDNEPNIDLLLRLRLNKFPLVLLDRQCSNVKLNSVGTDNKKMLYQTVQQLYNLKFRNLVFVTAPNTHSNSIAERIEGFTQAMLDCYGRLEKHNLLLCKDMQDRNTTPVLSRLLKRYDSVDAVIMHDCSVSVNFAHLCNRNHIPIGEKLVLIDDESSSDLFHILNVQIGRIKQDSYEIGYQAAKLLHKNIDSGTSLPEIIRIPASVRITFSPKP